MNKAVFVFANLLKASLIIIIIIMAVHDSQRRLRKSNKFDKQQLRFKLPMQTTFFPCSSLSLSLCSRYTKRFCVNSSKVARRKIAG